MKLCLLPPRTIASGGVLRHLDAIRRYTKHTVVDNPASADIVHVHAGWSSMRRDIYTCHGLNIITQDTPYYFVRENQIVEQNLRNAPINITVSNFFAAALQQKGFRIDFVIPNGTDINYGIKPAYEPFVLWLGRLDPIKRPEELIHIANEVPNLKFVATLPQVCEKQAKYGNVACVGENIPFPLAQDLLRRCGVYLLTSELETFSISILEAWAMRKPVVARRMSGAPAELIRDNIDGMLYDNIQDATDKINRCLSKSKLYGEAGFEHVQDFQWQDIIKITDEVYDLCSIGR